MTRAAQKTSLLKLAHYLVPRSLVDEVEGKIRASASSMRDQSTRLL